MDSEPSRSPTTADTFCVLGVPLKNSSIVRSSTRRSFRKKSSNDMVLPASTIPRAAVIQSAPDQHENLTSEGPAPPHPNAPALVPEQLRAHPEKCRSREFRN